MKTGKIVGMVGIAGLFFMNTAPRACAAQDSCQQQTALLESESRCADNDGIPTTSGGGKVGCFADPAVLNACGPEGRLTRLHAWSEWLRKLKDFQSQCAVKGGEFAFADPNFTEPSDESFCLAARPEVGNSFFEEPTCNFRSLCPAVQVVCQLSSCHGEGDFVAARETASLIASR
jgi:hypothetical protein